jgi:fructose-specific component phosphotransferase system IIB-like protein
MMRSPVLSVLPSSAALRRLWMPLLAGVVVVAGCGASISFHFGEPPIAPISADRHTRCTFQKRIVVRRATLAWTDYHRLGNVVVITGDRVHGLSFYQGTKLVSADSVLNAVKDPELALAYRNLYASERKAYRTGMIAGWSLLGGALLTGAIGSGLLADYYINNRRDPTRNAGFVFASISALALLVGVIELGFGYGSRGVVEAYENLFLARSYESRMIEAVRRYNIKATETCSGGRSSGDAPPD